jgi:hypothetical protein
MAAGNEPTTSCSRFMATGPSTRERSAREEKGALDRIPWKGRRQGREPGRGAPSSAQRRAEKTVGESTRKSADERREGEDTERESARPWIRSKKRTTVTTS